ncbi:hypothetical protein [Clostridium manihotivorum]|nr:hypothetical protein [Clostridium manihotivorum]
MKNTNKANKEYEEKPNKIAEIDDTPLTIEKAKKMLKELNDMEYEY